MSSGALDHGRRRYRLAAVWMSPQQDGVGQSIRAYAGGSPGSSPVAIGSPERDQSLYEPT
jgi:hypothetical protein